MTGKKKPLSFGVVCHAAINDWTLVSCVTQLNVRLISGFCAICGIGNYFQKLQFVTSFLTLNKYFLSCIILACIIIHILGSTKPGSSPASLENMVRQKKGTNPEEEDRASRKQEVQHETGQR